MEKKLNMGATKDEWARNEGGIGKQRTMNMD
jgi:hypothetical protein